MLPSLLSSSFRIGSCKPVPLASPSLNSLPLSPSLSFHSSFYRPASTTPPPIDDSFVSFVEPVETGGAATSASLDDEHNFNSLQPAEIKKHLDSFIIGQDTAKKAVAVAMRNRWRRKHVPEDLRREIIPKNILMMGPTGVGKTEVARRMAKLADAPFIKVEATKFTEVGFRGQDVDSIIKDLVDVGIHHVRERELAKLQKVLSMKVEENLLDLLIGEYDENEDRHSLQIRKELRGALKSHELEEISVSYQPKPVPKNQAPNVSLLFGQPLPHVMPGKPDQKAKKMPIKEVRPHEEQVVKSQLIQDDAIIARAIKEVEEYGIVFIDEIDKIVGSSSRIHQSPDASDEGVQRDLLPIIEGTKITTDHGDVDTSKILFIAAGAFHHVKPSDLLAELQGRLPIRVQLEDLTPEHLYRIMTEPTPNLVRQQIALLKTENVDLQFTEGALRRIANIASEVNNEVENIGARRLYTVMEKILEDLSFNASEHAGSTVMIGVPEVEKHMEEFKKKDNLKSYIL